MLSVNVVMTSLPFTLQTSLGKGGKTFARHVRLKFDPLGNDIVDGSGSRIGGYVTVEDWNEEEWRERSGGKGREGEGRRGEGSGGKGREGEERGGEGRRGEGSGGEGKGGEGNGEERGRAEWR